MIRNRGSVPIAESMSAKRAISILAFLPGRFEDFAGTSGTHDVHVSPFVSGTTWSEPFFTP